MANPVCTQTSLVDSAACFGPCAQNPAQQRALTVYFMIQELAAIGGTDYRSQLTGTLITDAQALWAMLNPAQRLTASVAIAYNRAVTAGASLSTDINTFQDEVNSLLAYKDLDALYGLLLCKLGTHKAYPQ